MARQTRRNALLGAALAAALGACDSVPDDAIEECSAAQVIPGAVATDILFVIDDSISMGEEQTLLRSALGRFVGALAASPIANDFQIGVTSTSVEEFSGAAVAPAGTLVGAGVMSVSSPTLATDFDSAVAVGTGGSNREQPFRAALLALEKSAPGQPNEGFLRPGAKLAIIFLSDEDDCSGPRDTGPTPILDSADCREEKIDPASTLTPVSAVAAALAGPIQGETRETVVAAIVGVAPGTLELSCGRSFCANNACSTAADEGSRFLGLLGALGAGSTRLASICDTSFDQALSDFATVILSQTMPLDGAPADWRMLVAHVESPVDGSIPCRIAPADADAATRNAADAIYDPPLAGRPASLTFQNACALEQGDRVFVDVVCAG